MTMRTLAAESQPCARFRWFRRFIISFFNQGLEIPTIKSSSYLAMRHRVSFDRLYKGTRL
jgi:hypothetical protein